MIKIEEKKNIMDNWFDYLQSEICNQFLDLENEKERLDFINDALNSIPIKSDKASRGMYN